MATGTCDLGRLFKGVMRVAAIDVEGEGSCSFVWVLCRSEGECLDLGSNRLPAIAVSVIEYARSCKQHKVGYKRENKVKGFEIY